MKVVIDSSVQPLGGLPMWENLYLECAGEGISGDLFVCLFVCLWCLVDMVLIQGRLY